MTRLTHPTLSTGYNDNNVTLTLGYLTSYFTLTLSVLGCRPGIPHSTSILERFNLD